MNYFEKKMKIVQINCFYQFASTGRTTYELHHYLMDHGVDSYVFYGNKAKTIEKGVSRIGTDNDTKIHGLLSRITGKQGYFSKGATRKLLSRLDDINPDVVILRVLHSNSVNIPMLLQYLAKKDIATIVVLHDCWLFTGHCNYYSSVGCMKWQTECNHCPRLHDGGGNPTWFFDTSKKVFYDRVRDFGAIPRLAAIGVSDWITNEAKKSVILKEAKIKRRIYNWIDLSVFTPKDTKELRNRLGIKQEEFVILGVATTWGVRKGLNVFIDIAKQKSECKVVLVGNMPEGIDLPNNVIAAGSTSDTNELAMYYSMADVFISPSQQETFGKVIAEAMACGTPCLVNNATAMPELVADGCGYSIDNCSVESFCKYIDVIKEQGKEAYSEACINKALKSFNKELNIKQYLSLFNEMMSMK